MIILYVLCVQFLEILFNDIFCFGYFTNSPVKEITP